MAVKKYAKGLFEGLPMSASAACADAAIRKEAYESVMSIRRQALQDALKAIFGEHLSEDLDDEADQAYDDAVSDCFAAVQELLFMDEQEEEVQ